MEIAIKALCSLGGCDAASVRVGNDGSSAFVPMAQQALDDAQADREEEPVLLEINALKASNASLRAALAEEGPVLEASNASLRATQCLRCRLAKIDTAHHEMETCEKPAQHEMKTCEKPAEQRKSTRKSTHYW